MEVRDHRVQIVISIHALLAESDDYRTINKLCALLFLSTLSLRRATLGGHAPLLLYPISIHALLAESDCPFSAVLQPGCISIHALLAESDRNTKK